MFKKIIYFLVYSSGLFFYLSANAQPGTQPSTYPSDATINYVRTWNAKAPQTDPNKIIAAASTDSFVMTTQYMDGLGRPIQTVVKGMTPLGNDLVTATTYDEFGREQFKYLPFSANNTGGNVSTNDGLFKLNPFQQQASFYDNANSVSPIKGQNESYFYYENVFEPSPLNRVTNAFAPGNSWVGNSIGVGQQYLINTTDDSVRIWIAGLNPSDAPTTSRTYDAGTLYKSVTVDEKGKQVVEYKDNEGKVILKKVQFLDNPDLGTGHIGWLCTYYIYDDLNNLRFVLQPLAVQNLLYTGSWNISDDIRDELCFYYGYDGRNRITTKKVPGAKEVYMVYDTRDRLVYTQDANMRNKNWWLTTIYDNLNRPVMTAMMTFTGTRSSLEAFAADPNNLSSATTVTVQGSNLTDHLAITTRETGRNLYEASQSIDFKDGFETEPTAEFTADINTSTTTSTTSYLSTANPFPTGASYKALTITNYDDYSQTAKSYNTTDNSKLTSGNNLFQESLPSNNSQQTKGMVTSTKVWVLEDAANLSMGRWLETVNFYDEKGRVIQAQSDNVAQGQDVSTSKYDFSGKLLCNYIVHQNPNADVPVLRVQTNTQYDKAGRVSSVTKVLNDNPATARTVSNMSYDELGQLKTKTHYRDNNGTVLETLDYDYNIRGWMLGVNRDFAKTSSSTSNYFGFDLGYDKNAIAPTGGSSIGTYSSAVQLNGNITGMLWKSKGDNEIRKYDFSYDNVNRLTGAAFSQITHAFNSATDLDFSVSNLSYDYNGNILSMNQKGWKVTGNDFIDQLTYHYLPNSNKLQNVIDASNQVDTKLGDFRSSEAYMTSLGNSKPASAIDYGYDDNGNLQKDLNKDIGTTTTNGITYNYLNLPDKITVQGKGTIQYIYDAAGNKLKKITSEGDKTTATLYLFGNYVNDTLQFLPMEEGRIRPVSNVSNPFTYDYFIKDHLGNVRTVLTDEQKIDAYPVLTFEGEPESDEVNKQNAMWENKYGQPINVAAVRTQVEFGETTTNAMLVRGTSGEIGATKLLKVMAGDRLHVKLDFFYPAANATTNNDDYSTFNLTLSSLINSFNSSSAVTPLLKENSGAIQSQLNSDSYFTDFITPAGYSNSPTDPSPPKAYLGVLFFDEQFRFNPIGSGIYPIHSSTGLGTIDATFSNALTAEKSGYAYVYFANQSNEIVYFDNFSLSHERSPLLEETHYYPFGLTMQGITSQAIGFGQPKSKIKFNGYEQQNQEFSDGTGLDWYDYKHRFYDDQIGRFFVQDGLADQYVYYSPYQFAGNEVPNAIDLDGLEPSYANPTDVIYQYGEGIANAVGGAFDRIKGWFSDKTEVSSPTPVRNTSVVTTTEFKTTVGTDFGGYFSALKNAGPGNTVTGVPVVKVDTKLTSKVELKQETAVGNTKLTTKTSLDGKSTEVKGETTVTIRKIPVTVGVSTSTNSQTGENKKKLEVGTGNNTVKGKVIVEGTKQGNNTSSSVGVGVEINKGNVKHTTSFGLSF